MSDISIDFGPLDPKNAAALAFFLLCWLLYQPLLNLLGRRGGAVINADLAVVRTAWMHNMASFRNVSSLVVIKTSSRLLFDAQLGLVLLTLARGLLDFIWGIRQLNYVLAVIGATPEGADDATHHAFGDVAGRVLNPALHAVNSGVRGYYFALAAASWLFGPLTFMAATAVAVSLLVWRQRRSPSARAIADLRKLLEATPET